jgi:phage FluMu protein Com
MNLRNVNTPKRIKQWEDAAAKSRIKVECPHCKSIGSINVYKSLHFNNCDFKNGIPQEYLEIIKYDEEHSRLATANHFGYSRIKIKRILDECKRSQIT